MSVNLQHYVTCVQTLLLVLLLLMYQLDHLRTTRLTTHESSARFLNVER